MIDLKNRRIDDYGQVIISEEGLYELLMMNKGISGFLVDDNDRIKQFNNLCKAFDHKEDQLDIYVAKSQNIEEYHKDRQNNWFIPDKFKNLDVKSFLLNKCKTQTETDRVLEEWDLFVNRDMVPVLAFLIYLVDHFRSHNIVWGVGRGSSVSSFCLYLIGVHKINSLKFNLDIQEFLK